MKKKIGVKLTLITVVLTCILLVSTMLISYMVFSYRTVKETKEKCNICADLGKEIFEEDSKFIVSYRTQLEEVYRENYQTIIEASQNGFDSTEEVKSFYEGLTASIFPQPGTFGLSYEKSAFVNEYKSILSSLELIGEGNRMDYGIVFFYDSTNNYIVYMMDTVVDSSYIYHYPCSIERPNQYLLDNVINQADPKPYLDDNSCIATLPIVADDSGNIVAYIQFSYSLDTMIQSQNDFMVTILIAFAISMLFIIFAYLFVIRKIVIEKILKLSDTTNKYITNLNNGKLIKISPEIKAKDELGQLSNEFDILQNKIEEYITTLEDKKTVEERMKAELGIATQIQLESLPDSEFHSDCIDIRCMIKPAREVGGDLYNYFMIDESHLFFVVADVSGKGVPAALFMMRCNELITARCHTNINLAQLVSEVNNDLCRNNNAYLFITAFFGVLNLETGKLSYVRAGHEQPFLIRDGKAEMISENSNIVLGAYEDFVFEEESLILNKNDRLFLYTDGVNEGINERNEEFGYDRIKNCLEKCEYNEIETIFNDLGTFSSGVEQFDDITMMVLRYSDDLIIHKSSPTFEDIAPISDQIMSYLKKYDFDSDKISEVGVILDDLINNHVSYAFYKKDDGELYIVTHVQDDTAKFIFIDNGPLFNPLNVQEPILDLEIEERQIGGLGLYLIKQLSDEISYSDNGNMNNLIIVKKMN